MMRSPRHRAIGPSMPSTAALRDSAWRHNLLAIFVAFAAVSVLYFNFQPAPAEADPSTAQFQVAHRAVSRPQYVQTAMLTEPDISPLAAGETTPSIPSHLTGRDALELNLRLLTAGRDMLSRVPDYTATFFRRERVGTSLCEPQTISLKLRHQPFSIYMRWVGGSDEGQEVLYVDGENDGEMLVHAGGWKARLLPCVKVNPAGAVARRQSRHPITSAGLLEVACRGIAYRERDLQHVEKVRCEMSGHEQFANRPCYRFDLLFADPEHSPDYRKTVLFVDRELSLAVCVLNYGWPDKDQQRLSGDKLDDATLIEHYAYTDIRLRQQLADHDFDRANDAYSFRR